MGIFKQSRCILFFIDMMIKYKLKNYSELQNEHIVCILFPETFKLHTEQMFLFFPEQVSHYHISILPGYFFKPAQSK